MSDLEWIMSAHFEGWYSSSPRKSLLEIVCEEFGVSRDLITSKCRNSAVVLPRSIIAKLALENTTITQAALGELLGGKDHSTMWRAKGLFERKNMDKVIMDKYFNVVMRWDGEIIV